MSEYMIDGALLTSIAEEVRSVDGSSSTLTPAQMQARLTAVKSSIDAAFSALTAKEVEVPSGSNVHGLADLIATIEVGGGLPTGLSKVAYGTVTPSYNVSSVKITHGLGVAPNFAILFGTSGMPSGSYHMIATYVLYKSSSSVTYANASGYNSSNDLSIGGIYKTVSTSSALTDTTCTFSKSSYYAGTTSQSATFSTSLYRWIAGVYA